MTSECKQGHSKEVVITTFIQGVCLCLLWPNSRLFQLLPGLSHCSQPLYQHSVRNSVLRNQIVYTDSRQYYIPARVLSDDTKVISGYTSYDLLLTALCGWKKQWECVRTSMSFFRGTPDDSAPWNRAYPEPLTLNSALLGHHLQSGDRGRVSAPPQMWQQWEFLGLCDVISASYAVCRMGWLCTCVYVCLERQTGCDDKLQGGFHGWKKNQNW